MVLGQVLVRGVQVWLIATGVFNACFEVVWDNDLRYAAYGSKKADVCADSVGQVLTPVGLGISVVAGTQYADNCLSLSDLAGVTGDDGDCLTSIVHEDFLPTFVRVSH